MSRDTFTKNRLEWVERIAADNRLPPSSLRVAVFIAKHLNRASGDAWPSQERLAAETCLPERTVCYGIKALCDFGYLEKRRAGFGRSNRYSIGGISTEGSAEEANCITATDCVNDEHITATDCVNDNSIPATDCCSFQQRVAAHSRNGLRTNPYREPSEEEPLEEYISPPTPSRAAQPKAKRSEEDARFEEFYRAYPKKASKGRARKAWAKAVKLATPETIIAGAMRYAAERAGQDATYTRHPATWLNDEAWHDEPAPAQQPGIRGGGGHRSAKEHTRDAINRFLEPRRSTVDIILETLGGSDDV